MAATTINGRTELVVANFLGSTVSAIVDYGAGGFGSPTTFPSAHPISVVSADVNGDGVPDLITANFGDDTLSVLLGNVDVSFRATAPAGTAPVNTPLIADLNGDGIADEAIRDQNGDILFRGLPALSGGFAPPVVLNAGDPASDLAVVRTAAGFALAAIDANPDLSTPGQPVYRVTLYTVGPTGQAGSTLVFTTADFPERIVAGDLTGDGLDDLVLANALNNSVTVAFQTAAGFASPQTFPVGVAPSDLVLADVDGDGRLDVVVADRSSGDVTVLLNDPTHSFATVERFRGDRVVRPRSDGGDGGGRVPCTARQPGGRRLHRRRPQRPRGGRSGRSLPRSAGQRRGRRLPCSHGLVNDVHERRSAGQRAARAHRGRAFGGPTRRWTSPC